MPAERQSKKAKTGPPRKRATDFKSYGVVFHRYHRSNAEPAAADIPIFRSAQVFYGEKLASLDASILEAQEALERLQNAHRNYQAAYDLCRSASSVVRRVPLDVWREIFLFCHPPHERMVMSFSQMPLLLTQVCRSWRYVALETPDLWTRLYIPPFVIRADPLWSLPCGSLHNIDFLTKIPTIIHERCDLLDVVLKRSRNRPLSISITMPRMWEFLSFRAEMGITKGGLYLDGVILDTFTAMSRVYSILEPHIPRIEEAYLSRCMIDYISAQDDQNILSSPRLRILRIHNLRVMTRFPDFVPSNWAHLTILSISSPSAVSWVMALFRMCTKLVECSLHIHHVPTVHQVANGAISLPDLKILSITEGGKTVGHGHRLYSFLVMPSVESVCCYEMNFAPPPYLASALTLLPRIQGLQKLQINPALFTNQTFSQICQFLPTLSHLVLGSTTHTSPTQWLPTSNIFAILSARCYPTPDQTGIDAVFPLPSLQFLEIHNAPISDMELYTFMDAMLCPGCPFHARLRPGTVRLNSLTATFRRALQSNVYCQLVNDLARKFGIHPFNLVLKHLELNFLEPLSTTYGIAAVPVAS